MHFAWAAMRIVWVPLLCFNKGQQITAELLTNSPFIDNRHKFFDLNEGANITCSNKTWREMIYSIWKVKLKGRLCSVAFHINGSRHDTCENGMELRNGTSGESYLHIPQFTLGNQGVYLCETAYWGGTYNAEITVSARVPPQIFSRLEELHNGTVAVCSAVGGNPAASISWRTQWNSTANQTSTRNSNGTYTVESRLVLPGRVSRENLSCIVTHPSWPGGFKETPQPRGSLSIFGLQSSVLMVCAALMLFGVVTSCYILWRPSKAMGRRKRRLCSGST
ncbi:cell surface glycoprotein CD200 receptor 2-like [Brienomyrus brachyistius]|uniref:cell surface glycoprotein CD200 receptor 2-like n=1 Tax=Brienomyrus brachyistius TaxID=42636 RepID=UPI0020B3475E|nr:cell surface glycoprotein CD200 receptor 2-like [Brienomyrus brachyistius]